MFPKDDIFLSYLPPAMYYSRGLGGMKATPGRLPHVTSSLNVPMAIIGSKVWWSEGSCRAGWGFLYSSGCLPKKERRGRWESPYSLVNSFKNRANCFKKGKDHEALFHRRMRKVKDRLLRPWSHKGVGNTQPSKCAGGENLSLCRAKVVALYAPGFHPGFSVGFSGGFRNH